jgi:DnaK suppressor protein
MVNEKKVHSVELDLAKIRKDLVTRKLELEEVLKTMSKEQVTDDQVQDPGDQASSLTMEALLSSLQNNEFAEYTMLVKAINSVDAGTYGICVDCSQQISEKRLKYYPNASRCLVCQEAAEIAR